MCHSRLYKAGGWGPSSLVDLDQNKLQAYPGHPNKGYVQVMGTSGCVYMVHTRICRTICAEAQYTLVISGLLPHAGHWRGRRREEKILDYLVVMATGKTRRRRNACTRLTKRKLNAIADGFLALPDDWRLHPTHLCEREVPPTIIGHR